MTFDDYQREYTFLLEILKDAQERGDIYHEYDVKDKMYELQGIWYREEEQ